jgi:hypothetical protein
MDLAVLRRGCNVLSAVLKSLKKGVCTGSLILGSEGRNNRLRFINIVQLVRLQSETYHELGPAAIGFDDGPLGWGKWGF